MSQNRTTYIPSSFVSICKKDRRKSTPHIHIFCRSTSCASELNHAGKKNEKKEKTPKFQRHIYSSGRFPKKTEIFFFSFHAFQPSKGCLSKSVFLLLRTASVKALHQSTLLDGVCLSRGESDASCHSILATVRTRTRKSALLQQ